MKHPLLVDDWKWRDWSRPLLVVGLIIAGFWAWMALIVPQLPEWADRWLGLAAIGISAAAGFIRQSREATGAADLLERLTPASKRDWLALLIVAVTMPLMLAPGVLERWLGDDTAILAGWALVLLITALLIGPTVLGSSIPGRQRHARP